MLKLLLAVVLLVAVPALAEQKSVAWSSACPTCDGTKVYCTLAKPYGAAPVATIPIAQNSASFDLAADVTARSFFCVARHYKGSDESPNSNEIQIPIAVVIPPPTNFRLTVNLTLHPDGRMTAKVARVVPLKSADAGAAELRAAMEARP